MNVRVQTPRRQSPPLNSPPRTGSTPQTHRTVPSRASRQTTIPRRFPSPTVSTPDRTRRARRVYSTRRCVQCLGHRFVKPWGLRRRCSTARVTTRRLSVSPFSVPCLALHGVRARLRRSRSRVALCWFTRHEIIHFLHLSFIPNGIRRCSERSRDAADERSVNTSSRESRIVDSRRAPCPRRRTRADERCV